jgi:catechol 2,3-dioxygenase-like lactoylglutathione lyase family enzyme
VQPQPLIAVHDVQLSSRWYQAVLGGRSGHGGADYEQIVRDGSMLLQIHRWDAHEHPNMGDPALRPYGNGAVLWFQTDDFDDAVSRVKKLGARVLEEPKVNPLANHREVWLQDPDGYVVVIAGPHETLD